MLAANALTTLERMKLMLGLTNKDASLDRLKLMLGLSENNEIPPEQLDQMLSVAGAEDEQADLIIEMLINKASSWVERMTGRRLGRQSYHQWYDADGSQDLVLIEYPIVSIESIKEDGKLVDPCRYDFGQTGHIGVVYRDEGWLNAGWRRGLAYDIVARKRVIEVEYTAGYVLPKDAAEDDPQTLPADLEGLVWDMVAQAYAGLQNGSQGLGSFSISDVSWKFDKSTNPEWVRIIDLYRRY